MTAPAPRDMLMAAASHALGMRAPLKVEKSIAGQKAFAVRSHIAHRAMMAQLFRRMKRATQRKR